jgi:transcriptional regulator with PAS, ATPase and Fis domain
MVIINEKGEIEFLDRLTEKVLQPPTERPGEKVQEIIPYSEMIEVISVGCSIWKTSKTKDRETIVSRFPLFQKGKVIGAFGRVILHSFEELERVKKETDRLRINVLNAEKKMKSEYQATYTFDHILGVSERIKEQKELARRMART